MYATPLSTPVLASDAGGEHNDPGEEEILATTDVVVDGVVKGLAAGRYHARVTITTTNLDTPGAPCEIRHCAGANNPLYEQGDVIERQVVNCPVDQCWPFDVVFALEQDDAITVVPYLTGFLGTVWVAINYQRIF